MFLRVIEDVYIVGGAEYSNASDCFVYLLNVNPPILIDAGLGKSIDKIIDNIYEAQINPFDIGHLILTHCHIDHIGGARYLKEKFSIKIIAHEKDADAIEGGDEILTAADWYNIAIEPVKVDIYLKGDGGDIFEGIGLKWFHIPGHTPGSIALMYKKGDQKILFGQDIHGPLMSQFKSNRDDYKRSLQYLLRLHADILCEGHYGVIRGKENVRDFINQFI